MSIYVCNVASEHQDDTLPPPPIMNFDERVRQLKQNVAEKFAKRKTAVENSDDDDVLPPPPAFCPDVDSE